MRILIVEDNLLTRVMMERYIEKWGYTFYSVDNINSALALILTEKIQMVITDWIMPGGNGTVLCQQVRALKLPFYTYLILVTSLEDSQYAVEGMDAGADDFIRKPLHFDELHARIKAGKRVLALEKKLTEAIEIINRDLSLAANMQHSLLPIATSNIQGISIDWLLYPSTSGSGDTFNFFRLDESHVGFHIIDVAGHGIASAMQSSILSRLMSPDTTCSNLLKFSSPEAPYYALRSAPAVITNLNQDFQTDVNNILFFTMIYGVIDTISRTIDLCQAGHPYPIFLPSGKPAEFIIGGGLPVGVIIEATYQSVQLNYNSGDRLFLYSDGITECESVSGEMFGAERLQWFVNETRHLKISEVISQINELISSWRGGNYFEDDVSLVILEFC
ncbi:PP2C family protein-serine/threonine phosphatase [Methylobacter sp. S3L5C]|uniref:PP2C family protein-serine/threonine phosphatase n=1 Tax=Methylobacter sp. S3L5C TaxID=2839024 RepID=UPI001FAD6B4D|nr:SpoIIE family protein phosphatase [Methylobacter sp. S3L5C]UOA09143.1 SpoIIE family protein phosphatase [Methylobacter sp. S3L5C]